MKGNIEKNNAVDNERWYEIFGLGPYGPSVQHDRDKMVKIPGHAFLKF